MSYISVHCLSLSTAITTSVWLVPKHSQPLEDASQHPLLLNLEDFHLIQYLKIVRPVAEKEPSNALDSFVIILVEMSDPKYAYPYPAQGGYYQGPPVMAPPQYAAAPPPRRNTGFLEGCLAALCCCCLLDECCCDPSII
ncbi:uncharacterized protein [Arachis hypogaea]|uniref:uncharacterized protein isoform X2 n=1 Tax=Arachis hypogaea TaxID=3818 RepID=UPI000DEC71E0|nr:uncharacterized protein LOC112754568 isoform X2 [Arachis hypogaea]